MITEEIESKEKRKVEVIDIPNAFIQNKQPDNERVIIHFRVIMAGTMCMIAPEIYQPCFPFDRGGSLVCPIIECYLWDTKINTLFLKSVHRSI